MTQLSLDLSQSLGNNPRHESEVLDDLCLERTAKRPNVIVPWILMAGYLYYHLDFSILSDGLFDRLCKQLLSDYAAIHHRHKTIITYGHLTAESLFDLKRDDYPSLCRSAAVSLVYDHYDILLEGRLCTITLDPDNPVTYIVTPR